MNLSIDEANTLSSFDNNTKTFLAVGSTRETMAKRLRAWGLLTKDLSGFWSISPKGRKELERRNGVVNAKS